MKTSKRSLATGLLITLIALLVVGYLLAPLIAKYYLNHHVLKDMGSYTGKVEDIDLNLIKGSYNLQDITIHRKDGSHKDVPFFSVDEFWVSVSWEALKNKALLVEARLDSPTLNFLDARKSQDKQSGAGTNWLDVFESLIPTTLHRLQVQNGTVHFRNFDTTPEVNLEATGINGFITNLTNVKSAQGKRVATGEINATLFNGASFGAKAQFDPFDYDDFEFAGHLKNVELVELNSFSKAYGNIDFEDGHGDIYTELTATGGELDGYIKPLFTDVNIMSWEQDVEKQNDNPLQLLWEGSLGFIKTLLTNTESEKVAAQLDISGNLSDLKFSSWQAVGSFLKNAFIDSLDSSYESYTSFTEDESEKPTGFTPKNKSD